jgi:RNA polymerase sigma-70 factor (ECF subfamily)
MMEPMEQQTEHAPSDPREWVDRYGDALYRHARLRLRDADLAEEVVQETFLAALRGRDTFTGTSTEQTWLTGILRHKILDVYRAAGREERCTSLDEAPDLFDRTGHWREPIARWPRDPGELVEEAEFLDVLDQCIAGLPTRAQRAFLLREGEQLETTEVRELLGVSASNLGVILHRARLKLRRCLEINWFCEPGGTP